MGIATYVVAPVDGMWKVSLPGDSQPDSLYAKKSDAVARAEQLARRFELGQVVVRTLEGAIEKAYFTSPAGER